MDFASDNAARTNNSSATEAQKNVTTTSCSSTMNMKTIVPESLDTDEQDEMEKIKWSTSIVTGVCGTYAVACRQGLIILPHRPDTSVDPMEGTQRQSSNPWDNEVNSFIQSASSTDSRTVKDRGQNKTSNRNLIEQMKLSYGDRVQVVSMMEGCAKLARGYGFIECKNSTDLVKGKILFHT
jgi:hypothetical protein